MESRIELWPLDESIRCSMKIITQYSQNKRYLEANFALVSVQPPFEVRTFRRDLFRKRQDCLERVNIAVRRLPSGTSDWCATTSPNLKQDHDQVRSRQFCQSGTARRGNTTSTTTSPTRLLMGSNLVGGWELTCDKVVVSFIVDGCLE